MFDDIAGAFGCVAGFVCPGTGAPGGGGASGGGAGDALISCDIDGCGFFGVPSLFLFGRGFFLFLTATAEPALTLLDGRGEHCEDGLGVVFVL